MYAVISHNSAPFETTHNMQDSSSFSMSHYQTTGKRIIRWILLNYFTIGQSVFNIVHAYTSAKHPLEYMACPTYRLCIAKQRNIINGYLR
jgi:hypothetical protein